ncbi:stage II sporulation protein P [Schnuerera ultunensis]|uniref:Putative Stage II sporulation P n=1 Tax=[Clostridium] ultunense Esp TaxID=1288971 RepID=A0A1M4PPP4_9FIRM|nr:stage II sporulation protein P [Schnuerera ultunensis]SHD77454.1 putative Stage II sporulation P [[Clostridium] ultunense Esp]
MRGKDSRNNYIIFALICLIVFNIGTMLINWKEDKAEPVFSEEKSYFEDGSAFISLFSRTSSIINLYKIHQYKGNSWNETFYKSLSPVHGLKEFLKAQFPSILFMGNDSKSDGETEERDIENNPTLVEDFIIIDRLEEYEDLIIINDSKGDISVSNVPKPLNINPLKIDREKPYILIYHTHGTESYSSLDTNLHHTTDKKLNVITIGEIISKTLEENGHKVEHVIKYHDVPSYNKSYTESLKTVNEKIKDNNNFKILLDIHRDGHDHNDPKVIKNMKNLIEKFKIDIDGKKAATFYFVIGPDSPNKEAVLSFAKYIKAVTDTLYPNLCTGIMIKPVGKYNQFLSDYSALIEVGSNLNTMEEAMETARILGEILSIVVENIQE